MKNNIVLSLLLLVIFLKSPPATAEEQMIPGLEPLKKEDRILILAPHPDDESIACAGIIQEAVKAGSDLHIVYLTNGDHNQFAFIVYEKRLTFRKGEFIHMGETRKKEAVKAMRLFGIDESRLVFLGYPDFGTFAIFSRYWQDAKPYRSKLTRISAVPYKDSLSYGAPYKGESILSDIKTVILKYKPNKIFVSHPADVNVDHRTFYLFLEIALEDLAGKIEAPKVYPYLVHCVGWPVPRHYHPDLALLPPKKFMDSEIDWRKKELTAQETEKKRQAILCYKSQTESSAFYLLAFARRNELFGNYSDVKLQVNGQPSQGSPVFSFLTGLFSASDIDNPEKEDGYTSDYTDIRGQIKYRVEGKNLDIVIVKSKEKNSRLRATFYLFGYSRGKPFAQMPKITMFLRGDKIKMFDAGRLMSGHGAGVEFKENEAMIKIPLELLGSPDFIFASVKTYSEPLHVDTTAFRKIIIKPDYKDEGTK